MNITTIIPIIIALIAVIISLAEFNYNKNRNQSKDNTTSIEQIGSLRSEFDGKLSDYKLEMEHRLTEAEGKIDIFWKDFERKMATYLHSPHTPETDKLLEKLADGILTDEERIKLCQALEGHIDRKEYAPEKVPIAIALVTILCSGI